MKIKYKKLHENATLPKHAKPGDAGVDLYATSVRVETHEVPGESYYFIEYGTGLAVEIPTGHVGLLFPRSSSSKTNLIMANSVGVIDESYRGEIKVRYRLDSVGYNDLLNNNKANVYQVGQAVAQLVIVPYVSQKAQFVEELSETERGSGGFGSTGV
jgi:dUTP pyrophosphatase